MFFLALLLLASSAFAQEADSAPERTAFVRYTVETELTTEDSDPLRLPIVERLMNQDRLGQLETEESQRGAQRSLRVKAVFGFESTTAFYAWHGDAATQALLAELRAGGTPPFRASLSVQRRLGR